MGSHRTKFDGVYERLQGKQGREYWKSLEELADSPEVREFIGREFPAHAHSWTDEVSRRSFIRLMGASLALGGFNACTRQPIERIVPYVNQPRELTPGEPLYFASAATLAGYAKGILVESHVGRPIKVEGNPDHPASLGATDIFTQAGVLELYDPDRSKTMRRGRKGATWQELAAWVFEKRKAWEANGGRGLRILTGATTSPSLQQLLATLLGEFPEAQVHRHEPFPFQSMTGGTEIAYGRKLNLRRNFNNAAVVVSFDADFLSPHPANLVEARTFIEHHNVARSGGKMSRLYAFESMPGLAGAMADYRFPVRASAMAPLLSLLAVRLGIDVPTSKQAEFEESFGRHLDTIANELSTARGAGLVLVGDGQPDEIHALALLINAALGNIGSTLEITAPIEAEPFASSSSLLDLTLAMERGEVETLLILGGNPVYESPCDIGFAEAAAKVKNILHVSLYYDETSALSTWHIPKAHFLESWGDAQAFDGTIAVQQPLIEPLYDGRSEHEVIGLFLGTALRSSYEWVSAYWQGRYVGSDFGSWWRQILHDGWIPSTRLPALAMEIDGNRILTAVGQKIAEASRSAAELEVVFRPDATIWDGRFSNNAWLQELPKPLSTLTWENAIFVSPQLAREKGLQTGQVVELLLNERSLKGPVLILPGHAEGSVTVTLGYGRRKSGKVGTGIGYDAYAIRSAQNPGFQTGLEMRVTGEAVRLAITQHHQQMDGHNIVREATLAEYLANRRFAHAHEKYPDGKPSLYPEFSYDGYKWGMAIDLNACIGCAACTIACQAENNIPVVGKKEVLNSREMHWIRIDRYYKGSAHNPGTYFMPVPCMHCENAPCEVVCPVEATVHDHEGLNEMVYNRCIGTRYCSNNCPYKVRRFNFLHYSDYKEPTMRMLQNPDVTVRYRGVMEKCTYCVQRISAARITAKKEDRTIQAGEVVPACAQVCPTEAIVFGDLNNPQDPIHRLKDNPLNYELLGELNTRPRTTYLARVTNRAGMQENIGSTGASEIEANPVTGGGKNTNGRDGE